MLFLTLNTTTHRSYSEGELICRHFPRHDLLWPNAQLLGIKFYTPRDRCLPLFLENVAYDTVLLARLFPRPPRTSICSDRCWLMVGFARSACKFSFLSYFYSTHLSRVATLLSGGGVGLLQAAFSAGQATRPIYAEFDRPTKAYISGTYRPGILIPPPLYYTFDYCFSSKSNNGRYTTNSTKFWQIHLQDLQPQSYHILPFLPSLVEYCARMLLLE